MIFDAHVIRALSFLFKNKRKERIRHTSLPHIYTTVPLLHDSCDPGATQRRHSCIRSTCGNAIVHTDGNNWTIYELRGLALRMYDYRGKRCVARTTGEPSVTHLLAPPSPWYRPLSSLSTACNYSRGHYISIPRLIVKIALGIQ